MKIDYEAAVSGRRNVHTQRGDRVRLISGDGSPAFPLVGFIEVEELPRVWRRDGRSWLDVDRSLDLIQGPEVIEFKRWVNVYPDNGHIGVHLSHEQAIAVAIPHTTVKKGVPVTIRITGNKIVIHGESE